MRVGQVSPWTRRRAQHQVCTHHHYRAYTYPLTIQYYASAIASVAVRPTAVPQVPPTSSLTPARPSSAPPGSALPMVPFQPARAFTSLVVQLQVFLPPPAADTYTRSPRQRRRGWTRGDDYSTHYWPVGPRNQPNEPP